MPPIKSFESKLHGAFRMTAASRKRKEQPKAPSVYNQEGFVPCSQDMTICGDWEDNRAKKKCPRLKEWTAKKER
jgi:hypothetical protein